VLEIAVAIQYLTPLHPLVAVAAVVEPPPELRGPTVVPVEVREDTEQVLEILHQPLHRKVTMVAFLVAQEVLSVLEVVVVRGR
jgi:hypothetical protein